MKLGSTLTARPRALSLLEVVIAVAVLSAMTLIMAYAAVPTQHAAAETSVALDLQRSAGTALFQLRQDLRRSGRKPNGTAMLTTPPLGATETLGRGVSGHDDETVLKFRYRTGLPTAADLDAAAEDEEDDDGGLLGLGNLLDFTPDEADAFTRVNNDDSYWSGEITYTLEPDGTFPGTAITRYALHRGDGVASPAIASGIRSMTVQTFEDDNSVQIELVLYDSNVSGELGPDGRPTPILYRVVDRIELLNRADPTK